MKILKTALLGALALATSGFGKARPAGGPIPFTDAYRDGYVLALWKNYSDAELATIIARVRKTGARHMTIPYFGCQSTIHSSDVGACQLGNPAQAVREARIALAQGFDVALLPIVATPQWDWRGEFDPDDANAWFASYKAWLKGLVQIANQLQLKEFIVGTEFTRLYGQESQWEELLTEFHALFHGPLVLTVNWNDLDHGFWSYADAIGVSFYFPLSSSDSPSPEELASGMGDAKSALMSLSRKYNLPIHITEAGYKSVNGTAQHPWNGNAADGANSALQAECFDAFRQAWGGERALVRADIWATTDPSDPNYATGFETLGKPAEAVLSRFFAQRAGLSRSPAPSL